RLLPPEPEPGLLPGGHRAEGRQGAEGVPGAAEARLKRAGRSAGPPPRLGPPAGARGRPGADGAGVEVVAEGGAALAREIDDLAVDLPPALGREEALQVALRLLDALSRREPPARRQAVDVGVDGEGRLAERLAHDDRRRLVPDAGQGLQLREAPRH